VRRSAVRRSAVRRPAVRRPALSRTRGAVSAAVGSLLDPERRRSFALIVLGFAAGAAVGVALLGARLDQVSLEREQLLVKKADLQIQVDRLREELADVRYGQAGLVVMSVNVIPEGLDELTRVRVRAEVASIVDDLVGRPVAELDPALAFHLLDGRTLTIEGAPVYLSVRAVVIGPETEFWVELRGTPAEGAESGG